MTADARTRKQALEEGRQRDISETAREAGLLVPVFITSTVWDNWIASGVSGIKTEEVEKRKLRSVLDKLLYFIRVHRQTNKSNLIYFPVPLTREGKEENVQLMSHLGPLERADQRPCITIMTPEEYDLESGVQ
ncbi:MAG TPA: DUF6573 family protein [Thermodesulfobacteriota bacterium]|nr:DUF6573 family protein [Thermodesulfobacteriota bacterium]